MPDRQHRWLPPAWALMLGPRRGRAVGRYGEAVAWVLPAASAFASASAPTVRGQQTERSRRRRRALKRCVEYSYGLLGMVVHRFPPGKRGDGRARRSARCAVQSLEEGG